MTPADVGFYCGLSVVLTLAAVALYTKGRDLFVKAPSAAHHRFTEDLQAIADSLIRAQLHVAEIECLVAAKIGKLPDQFVAPAVLASRMGYAIESAVVAEAKRRGIWPADVDLTHAEPLPGQDKPAEEPKPFTLAPQSTPPTQWREGKLYPFRRPTP